jgi:hypothetical protein
MDRCPVTSAGAIAASCGGVITTVRAIGARITGTGTADIAVAIATGTIASVIASAITATTITTDIVVADVTATATAMATTATAAAAAATERAIAGATAIATGIATDAAIATDPANRSEKEIVPPRFLEVSALRRLCPFLAIGNLLKNEGEGQ